MTSTDTTSADTTGTDTADPGSRRFDLAVFDIAGTTVDEGSAVYTAMRDALGEVDVSVSDDDLDRRKGTDKRTALGILLRTSGVVPESEAESTLDRVYSRFGELLDAAYEATPPVAMPGALDCFAALRERGIAIALTTGFTRRVAETVLGHAGISVGGTGPGAVDVLVTTDDVPAARPAPYLIHHAMEATDTRDVRRVVSAGDTLADIGSHRNAGVTSVAVLTGDTTAETLRAEGPDHLLDSVADLPGVLER